MQLRRILVAASLAFLLASCNLNVKNRESKDGGKEVDVRSSLGDLSVRTEGVDPRDTGLSVYPNSRLKENDTGGDNRANVNIDTPWFGVKVVALTYHTDDPPDKVWDYYKKEMAGKYGPPLECKPGSPDMDRKKQGKDDLVCHDEKSRSKNDRGVSFSIDDMELKVGTDDRQRIVAVKPHGSGSEFAIVYVVTREGREAI
jgi:hypothetical protein